MKILDVDLLQDGLKRNKAMLERLRNETENIERTVSGLVEMDELLKGAGGNAIRDFYAECHLPFLQFFQLFSVTYLQTLEQMESALQSLEPDPAGYIRQEFLEGELEQGLTLIGNLTEALTNEANSIMDSVSDIVALPHLDDSAIQEGVITSKKKRDDTVQQLNEFDYSQTVSLNPVEQDIQTMDTWLTDIEGMFHSGLTDVHFQSNHWGILSSRNTLKMELEARTSRIPGDTAVQPSNYDLTTMFSTFLSGASPLQFGYGGFIRKPTVLYGPSILGFASLPTHSTTKNINENVEDKSNELDEIYAAILKSNPELATDSSSPPQTYYANEPITYEGMRKVLGGNGSGTPDGLFGMGVGLSIAAKKGREIAADELFLNDFQTLKDPNASRIDKSIALFSLTPMGKLKKAAEGIEEGKDLLEHVIEVQKKAEKAKDAKKSVGDVEVKGTKNIGNQTRDQARYTAQNLLKNGEVSMSDLKSLIPSHIPNSFKPTDTITDGAKYEFTLSDGQKAIIRWHSPDPIAASKYPGSASGSRWTAQIKIGNKQLKSDGTWTKNQSLNEVHIPVEGK